MGCCGCCGRRKVSRQLIAVLSFVQKASPFWCCFNVFVSGSQEYESCCCMSSQCTICSLKNSRVSPRYMMACSLKGTSSPNSANRAFGLGSSSFFTLPLNLDCVSPVGHSKWILDRVEDVAPDLPIAHIPHHFCEPPTLDAMACREMFGMQTLTRLCDTGKVHRTNHSCVV